MLKTNKNVNELIWVRLSPDRWNAKSRSRSRRERCCKKIATSGNFLEMSSTDPKRRDATRRPRTSRQLVERRFTDLQRQLKYQGLQKNGIWTFFSEWFDCSGSSIIKGSKSMTTVALTNVKQSKWWNLLWQKEQTRTNHKQCCSAAVLQCHGWQKPDNGKSCSPIRSRNLMSAWPLIGKNPWMWS